MRSHPFALLIIGFFALGCSSCSGQPAGTIEPWAKSAPGSWVTMRRVITVSGRTEPMVSEIKLTVLRLTADTVVLEETGKDTSVPAAQVELPRVPPTTEKMSAEANDPDFPALTAALADLNTITAEGTETLQIGGRSIQAKWTEYGKGAITKKEWTSAKVPGALCRRITRLELDDLKQEILEEVTAFEKR